MSSRADAVTNDAPARSSGRNRVTSPCRSSTVTAAPSGRSRRVVHGDGQQVRVAVVEHPVLRTVGAAGPASAPSSRSPTRGRARPRWSVPVQARARPRAPLGGARRGVRRLAQRAATPRSPAPPRSVTPPPPRGCREPVAGLRPVGERRAAARAADRRSARSRGVGEPPAQCRRQARGIARRHEDAGPAPVRRPSERLRKPPDVAAHGRDGPRQRLGDGHAVGLGPRRGDDEVRRRVHGIQRRGRRAGR